MHPATASSFDDQPSHDDGNNFSVALDFVVSADDVFDRYNNAPCGYHSLDANGVFLRVNNTELRWLGYTRDEIVGQMRFADLLTPPSQKAFALVCADLRSGVAVHDVVIELCCADDATLCVRLSAVPLHSDTGEHLGSRATVFDASGDKQVSELRERERFAAKVLAATPGIIYVYDVVTQRNIFTSREIATELGYTPAEIAAMGETLFETLIHPGDLAKVTAHIVRVLAASDNSECAVTYRIRHADGVYRLFTSRDTVFARNPETGAVTQYLGVAHNTSVPHESDSI